MPAAQNPILRKLQVKTGADAPIKPFVFAAPAPHDTALPVAFSNEGLAWAARKGKGHGFILAFFSNKAGVAKHAVDLLERLTPEGLFWTAYPKKSSPLHQDLNRDEGWKPLVDAGWLPVRAIALDDDWSAHRWKPKGDIKNLTRKFETR